MKTKNSDSTVEQLLKPTKPVGAREASVMYAEAAELARELYSNYGLRYGGMGAAVRRAAGRAIALLTDTGFALSKDVGAHETMIWLTPLGEFVARQVHGVAAAQHFIDSPESFSDEEFQDVASDILAASQPAYDQDNLPVNRLKYNGGVPYLRQYDEARAAATALAMLLRPASVVQGQSETGAAAAMRGLCEGGLGQVVQAWKALFDALELTGGDKR